MTNDLLSSSEGGMTAYCQTLHVVVSSVEQNSDLEVAFLFYFNMTIVTFKPR